MSAADDGEGNGSDSERDSERSAHPWHHKGLESALNGLTACSVYQSDAQEWRKNSLRQEEAEKAYKTVSL